MVEGMEVRASFERKYSAEALSLTRARILGIRIGASKMWLISARGRELGLEDRHNLWRIHRAGFAR